MEDLFDVLRRSSVAQSWQDGCQFGHELLRIVPVYPNRVELEQDLEHLVVQGAVVGLEGFTRRPPLLGFVDVCSLVHAGNGPYRSLAVNDTASCEAVWLDERGLVGQQHTFAK